MTDQRPPGPAILDLTHPIAPGMPCYPGTEPPVFRRAFTLAEHGYAEQRLTLLTHTGTHLDAPAHMLPDGATLDHYPGAYFVGLAAVLDVSAAAGRELTTEFLQRQIQKYDDLDFVLLATGWSDRWGQASYFEGFPVLGTDAARWLVRRGLRGVGIDAVSVDAADSVDFPVHRILLGGGLVIVENLTGLRALCGRRCQFCCLPLKIAGADGAPVRAVAWPI